MDVTFEPAPRIMGRVRVPADKSISHRALLLAAMAKGRSTVSAIGPGRDVASTVECLKRLGVSVETSGEHATVVGRGWSVPSEADLDASNSGTTMRLLAGALAGVQGEFRISGDRSLSSRPMERVAVPLREMGAAIELAAGGRPPILVKGAHLKGIDYEMPVASAQVKGAVLLAGLQADGRTSVMESLRTRDHTERMLRWLGADIESRDGTVSVAGGALPLRPFHLKVPGDFSSAAYLVTAAVLAEEGEVEIDRLGLNPSRTGLIEVLSAMGAGITTEQSSENPEPYGSLRATTAQLRAAKVSGEMIPRVIDELPLIALAATRAEGTTSVTDASELRVKEADRVSALVEGLRALGASIEEEPDGFTVHGPVRLKGGVVDPRGDHRLALTFAVAAVIADGPVVVKGWECAAVSYPSFEADLRRLTG